MAKAKRKRERKPDYKPGKVVGGDATADLLYIKASRTTIALQAEDAIKAIKQLREKGRIG